MFKVFKNLLSFLFLVTLCISCSMNESDDLLTNKNLIYAENTLENCLKDNIYKGHSGSLDNLDLYFSITDKDQNIMVLVFYNKLGEFNIETYHYKILPYLDRQYVYLSLSCIDETIYRPYLQTLEIKLEKSEQGILYVRVNGSIDITYKTSNMPYPNPNPNPETSPNNPSNSEIDKDNTTPNVDNDTTPDNNNNNSGENDNPNNGDITTPENNNNNTGPETDNNKPNENGGNTSPENNNNGNGDKEDIENNKPTIPGIITNPLLQNFRVDLREHSFALGDMDDKRYRIDICPLDGNEYFVYSYKYNGVIRDPNTTEKLKNPHIMLYFTENYAVDNSSGHLILNGSRACVLLRSENRYFTFSDVSSFISNIKIEIKYNTPSSYHVKVTDYQKRYDKDEQWVKL